MTRLIDIHELRTSYWRSFAPPECHVNYYDEALDTMLLYIEKPKERIISYPVDDFISLLYRHSDNEVIGMSINYFFSKFLHKFTNTTWKLSNSNQQLQDTFDFEIVIHKVENVIKIEAGMHVPQKPTLLDIPMPIVAFEFDPIRVDN